MSTLMHLETDFLAMHWLSNRSQSQDHKPLSSQHIDARGSHRSELENLKRLGLQSYGRATAYIESRIITWP